jgi:putative pyruvate formate lyase activating enzyme
VAAAAALVRLMRGLEGRGCVNINFVTPTHMMPALAAAIVEARADGLAVPIVWNCGGYEAVEALRLLDGLVETYMPDFKFINPASAECYCRAPDYPDRAKEALCEMHRQVGDLVVEDGVAARGLLVRHLVMPGGAEEGRQIMDFLASLSLRTYVNVMGQYRPAAAVVHPRARGQYRAIDRRPTAQEVYEVRDYAAHLGLRLAD